MKKNFHFFELQKLSLVVMKNKPITINLKFDLKPDIQLKDFKDLKTNKYEIELAKKLRKISLKVLLHHKKTSKKLKVQDKLKTLIKLLLIFNLRKMTYRNI